MTAAAARSLTVAPEPAPVAEKPNLRQRILTITGHVHRVKATSQDERRNIAIGIEDVEQAIVDMAIEHGVVFRWSNLSIEPIDEPKKDGSTYRLWLERLRVRVENADDPEDAFEDEWADVGTNPMASTSFARKGYYKALFHITEEGDEGKPQPGRLVARPAGAQRPSQTAPSATERRKVDIPSTACVLCGDSLEMVYQPDGSAFVGHKTWRKDAPRCSYRFSPDEQARYRNLAPDPVGSQAAPSPSIVDFDFVHAVSLLPIEARRALAADERFAKREGENPAQWWARLEADQRLKLRAATEDALAQIEIPL